MVDLGGDHVVPRDQSARGQSERAGNILIGPEARGEGRRHAERLNTLPISASTQS